MTENELWIKNEAEHQEIRSEIMNGLTTLSSKLDTMERALSITPLIIKYICFPLIITLGLPFGIKELLPMFTMG